MGISSPSSILHTSTEFDSVTNMTSVETETWYVSGHRIFNLLQMVVMCTGFVTNTINIVIFFRIGLHDSVTVSFFSLSISDLLHLICFFTLRMMSTLLYEFGVTSPIVYLGDLAGWFGWMAVYFMDVSMYITVYATFQKCCCVAFPLTFKNTFTKRQSTIVIPSIFTVTFLIFLPVYIRIFYQWFVDPATKNKPLDWVALNMRVEQTVWRWMHRVVLTLTSQTVIIVSLIVITAKLKQSVKFRLTNKADPDSNTNSAKNPDLKLGQKELKAIQAVQFIAVIFIVATLPNNINSLMTIFYPRLYVVQREAALVFLSVFYFLGTINASINILVYLKYNTRYRSVFVSTFRGSKMA